MVMVSPQPEESFAKFENLLGVSSHRRAKLSGVFVKVIADLECFISLRSC